MAEKLLVNPIECEGHGACAELLPELIAVDEWGYPIIDDRPLPQSLERDARAAVSACPALALRLIRALKTHSLSRTGPWRLLSRTPRAFRRFRAARADHA